jgi:phosphoglycolate phosphatase
MANRSSGRRLGAILWDLDGTLIETRKDIATGVNLVLADLDLGEMSVEAVSRNVGRGTKILLTRCLEQRGVSPISEDDLERAYRSFLRHYGDHLTDHSAPYEGIPELLTQLAEEGTPMGLVSNKPEDLCRRLFEAFGFLRLFGVVLGGDSVGERKPHPAPMQHALEVLGASLESAVMVGDSLIDLRAAQATGIPVISVTWGFEDPEALRRAQPDHLVDSPAELRRLLLD